MSAEDISHESNSPAEGPEKRLRTAVDGAVTLLLAKEVTFGVAVDSTRDLSIAANTLHPTLEPASDPSNDAANTAFRESVDVFATRFYAWKDDTEVAVNGEQLDEAVDEVKKRSDAAESVSPVFEEARKWAIKVQRELDLADLKNGTSALNDLIEEFARVYLPTTTVNPYAVGQVLTEIIELVDAYARSLESHRDASQRLSRAAPEFE